MAKATASSKTVNSLIVGTLTAPLTTHQTKASKEPGAEPKFFDCLGSARDSIYGVRVPAMAASIPSSVNLAGHEVTLEPSVKDDGRATARGRLVADVDGTPRSLQVTITDHGDASWQVKASVTAPGGGKGSSPKVNAGLFV